MIAPLNIRWRETLARDGRCAGPSLNTSQKLANPAAMAADGQC